MKADKWACRSHTSPERCFCFHLKIQLWKFDSHFFIIIIIERVILNFMLTLIYTPSGWLRSGNVEFTTYSLYFGVNSHVVHVPHACVHQWSNVIDLNLAVIIIILLLIIPFTVCLGSPLQSSDSEHDKSLCCPYEEPCYFQATSTWYAFCMAWILSFFIFWIHIFYFWLRVALFWLIFCGLCLTVNHAKVHNFCWFCLFSGTVMEMLPGNKRDSRFW